MVEVVVSGAFKVRSATQVSIKWLILAREVCFYGSTSYSTMGVLLELLMPFIGMGDFF